jgi:TRAP-type C4-dicarboxylate transport system substrate-binding protein
MKMRQLHARVGMVISAAALACFLAQVGVGEAAAPQYKWKLAHIRPAGTAIDKDVHGLVDKLAKESGGRIVIEVYPASQLGDYTVVQERVSLGAIEMQVGPLGTTVDKRLNLPNAPYLAKNWKDARTLFSHDSQLRKKTVELLEKQGLRPIAGWPVYFGGIVLTKEPASPGDPDVAKNIKIRVPPIKSFELTAQALGYLATPIPWADTFTAMQSGIVNGAIGGGAEGYFANFRDLAKYYLAVNDHFEYWFLYTNTALWSKLSEADRKLIQTAADEMEKQRWVVAEQDEQANEKRLSDAGVKVIKFKDQELQKMADKSRKVGWPIIKRDIGAEFFDQVTADIK